MRLLMLRLISREKADNCVRGSDFGRIIQMGIDITRSRNIAVPEPFLDVLQRNALSIQHACAAVPQVMEADWAHPMIFQKGRKCLREIVRLDQFSHFIDIDVVEIILTVAVSADLSIDALL